MVEVVLHRHIVRGQGKHPDLSANFWAVYGLMLSQPSLHKALSSRTGGHHAKTPPHALPLMRLAPAIPRQKTLTKTQFAQCLRAILPPLHDLVGLVLGNPSLFDSLIQKLVHRLPLHLLASLLEGIGYLRLIKLQSRSHLADEALCCIVNWHTPSRERPRAVLLPQAPGVSEWKTPTGDKLL